MEVRSTKRPKYLMVGMGIALAGVAAIVATQQYSQSVATIEENGEVAGRAPKPGVTPFAVEQVSGTEDKAKTDQRRVREVIEGFRRNRAQFLTLRVTEHRVEQTTLGDKVETAHYLQDFWTDGVRFQSRSPRDAVDPDRWRFSDDDVTPVSLASTYDNYTIFSFLPTSDPPLRVWQGYQGKGETVAIVGNADYCQAKPAFWVPPLAAKTGEWGTVQRHPIDELFAEPLDRVNLIGATAQGNIITTRIQFIRFIDTGLKTDTGKELQQASVAEAWIDTQHGYLPWRIEFRAALALDGSLLCQGDLQKTVAISSLGKIEDVGFFPLSGTINEYVVDPAWKGRFLIPSEWMEGKTQNLPMVIGTTTNWSVSKVEANIPMTEELFSLSFPDGVTIVDASTGKHFSPLPTAPPDSVGQPAPEWEVAGWTDNVERKLSDYRGRVLVLEFWGKWCGPCLRAIPTMNRLQEKYRDQEVMFLAIHTAGPDIDEVRRVVVDHDYALVSAVDSGPFRDVGRTAARYGCRGFPTTIVIDRTGVVTFNSGEIPDEPGALERFEQQREERLRQAAIALNIEWPLDQRASLEQLHHSVGQLTEYLLGQEIDQALRKRE